jgi:6-phosphogluconolactonase (cycloisomerase 2 family)
MSNESTANSVLVFRRHPDGTLVEKAEVFTQGLGTGTNGDPLGSQGALTLNSQGSLLLAVNAGSNDVSSLAVTATGLLFAGKAPSGGTMPVSVAVWGNIAYVVNAGGTPNVTAFQIGSRGQLTMIANSTVTLPGGAGCGPAQVGVSPDGSVLVVTEKNTSNIDLFPIVSGIPGAPVSVPSSGPTPFGLTFGMNQTLIVSEAANSTVSSYQIENSTIGPTLRTITGSLADSGGAACWIVSNPAGRLVYVINSATATVSSIEVSPGGALQLLAAVAATTPSGSAPIDATFTPGGRYFYVISTSDGSMTGYSVQNGALAQVASATGLPLSIQGIAAR